MTNKHSEQQLQELYQIRKNQHKAPLELKESIRQHAKRQKASLWRWLNWQNALAFCCLVVVLGHLSKRPNDDSAATYTVSQGFNTDNQSVYYLDVNYLASDDDNESLASIEQQDKEHQDYLNSLAQLSNSRQLRGKVKRVDDELVIEVCQLGLVQISSQIVQQLRQQGVLHPLDPGQDVVLLADQQGWILGIEKAPSGPVCRAFDS